MAKGVRLPNARSQKEYDRYLRDALQREIASERSMLVSALDSKKPMTPPLARHGRSIAPNRMVDRLPPIAW